ncbi:MAG: hypothetical protein P8X43_07845 [Maritimibacter sp.]
MSDHHLKRIWSRSTGWVALALGLAACSAAQIPMDEATAAKAPGEIVADCCSGAGDYPDWAIELADANVELMRQVGLIQLRRPWRDLYGHRSAAARRRAVASESTRSVA